MGDLDLTSDGANAFAVTVTTAPDAVTVRCSRMSPVSVTPATRAFSTTSPTFSKPHLR